VKKKSKTFVEKLHASNFPATLLKIGSWKIHNFVFMGNLYFSMNLTYVDIVFIAVGIKI